MDQLPPLLPQIEAKLPPRSQIQGKHVLLRPLQVSDVDDLFDSTSSTADDQLWQFMPDGPFTSKADFEAAITSKASSSDPAFFAVVNAARGKVVGHVAFMRIDLTHRTIEIGHILFSSSIQRSQFTTECIYLMLRTVFEDLGFRRCEWKCNNRNEPSKRAALRFGFTFEGVFRQHFIIKGRNRDSAWFSLLDGEWPAAKAAFEAWLMPGNFDEQGKQRSKLADLRVAK